MRRWTRAVGEKLNMREREREREQAQAYMYNNVREGGGHNSTECMRRCKWKGMGEK